MKPINIRPSVSHLPKRLFQIMGEHQCVTHWPPEQTLQAYCRRHAGILLTTGTPPGSCVHSIWPAERSALSGGVFGDDEDEQHTFTIGSKWEGFKNAK